MILTEDECFAALSDDITAIEETRACEEEWAVIVAMCRAIESAVIVKLAVSQNALKDEIRLIWKPKCDALRQQLEAAQAEVAQWRVDFKEMVIERNAALARLAITEEANSMLLARNKWLEHALEVAGASPVEPSQALSLDLLERLSKTLTRLGYATPEGSMEHFNADLANQLYNLCRAVDSLFDREQPPAPGDTAITYMTGYSDAKEWAQQTAAAGAVPQPERAPLTDAEIEKLVMPYGFSSIQGFDHIKAYTRRVEAYIKQGGQHDEVA